MTINGYSITLLWFPKIEAHAVDKKRQKIPSAQPGVPKFPDTELPHEVKPPSFIGHVWGRPYIQAQGCQRL